MLYREFFRIATGLDEPYPYQARLADGDTWPTLLEIPTGLGKTEALVCAYLYRVLERKQIEPRLLVYTLPMRTLVEQTIERVSAVVARLLASGR